MTIFTCLRLLLQHPAKFWLEHHAELLLPSPASEWPTSNNTDLERMKKFFVMDMVREGREGDRSFSSNVCHIIGSKVRS